ncbi:MAG: site-2 protease family protein [Candidatus Pacebacteria bacterium]|nr:site-2 protease family protein [Candidatus Paceibacterota bacterium]MCK5172575.1 site-2 protease family protein [Planctomycetota bacterium]
MEPATAIFFIAILIMSIVIHEVAHGYVAEMLGDPTARMAGRLTLNPLPHLDMMGSIILPLILVVTQAGFVFGWAKPVPYNPYNLRKGKWGPAIVAIAGPLSNIFFALIFGMVLRFGGGLGLPEAFIDISVYIVFINILLAVFNMIPVPPLDGSKVLSAFLPYRHMHMMEQLERYGFIVILFIVFFLWESVVAPIVGLIFYLITGSKIF